MAELHHAYLANVTNTFHLLSCNVVHSNWESYYIFRFIIYTSSNFTLSGKRITPVKSGFVSGGETNYN